MKCVIIFSLTVLFSLASLGQIDSSYDGLWRLSHEGCEGEVDEISSSPTLSVETFLYIGESQFTDVQVSFVGGAESERGPFTCIQESQSAVHSVNDLGGESEEWELKQVKDQVSAARGSKCPQEMKKFEREVPFSYHYEINNLISGKSFEAKSYLAQCKEKSWILKYKKVSRCKESLDAKDILREVFVGEAVAGPSQSTVVTTVVTKVDGSFCAESIDCSQALIEDNKRQLIHCHRGI